MNKKSKSPTYVYIDAFNLYYGAVKGTPYKWLNIQALCERLFPHNDIQLIRYFTAKVDARPHDLDQPNRQNLYLRALATLPKVTIEYGHFLRSKKHLPLAGTVPPKIVEVVYTEEKGSDVNLATSLLVDAFNNRFEVAIVVSNDSDLLKPIMVVRNELGKIVGVLNPHRKHASRQLLKAANFFRPIRAGVLAACQFPDELTDINGTFRKPASW